MQFHDIGRRSPYVLLGAVVTALLLLVPGGASGTPAPAAKVHDPPRKTIVRVSGDAANGFGIHYFDGSSDFPPTDSEALAECTEYDEQVDRVKCRTQVRTWYYDLADLHQTIHYYRALLEEATSD